MSILNTQDNTIISSNFSNLTTLSEEEKNIIKQSQAVQLDSVDPQAIETGAESMISNFVQTMGYDATLTTEAYQMLMQIRSLGGFEQMTPDHLTIMSDLINAGL